MLAIETAVTIVCGLPAGLNRSPVPSSFLSVFPGFRVVIMRADRISAAMMRPGS
ncbi:hypothetical protein FHX11_003614 [Rhizobium sp. BK602]|nr:hypothetical protein [Rhizobium sp. BK602]